ncbi:hypothetical protein Pint_13951 [Pistacia integerrima]|uniref:Uncharacterized protein n=1 Tax=Pistacia integerrima TaxID=434235 RepID=A0ACC0Y7T8_9ROSI|nr:hypothetical protein Pint_13951 [Pistacia integerrima]
MFQCLCMCIPRFTKSDIWSKWKSSQILSLMLRKNLVSLLIFKIEWHKSMVALFTCLS